MMNDCSFSPNIRVMLITSRTANRYLILLIKVRITFDRERERLVLLLFSIENNVTHRVDQRRQLSLRFIVNLEFYMMLVKKGKWKNNRKLFESLEQKTSLLFIDVCTDEHAALKKTSRSRADTYVRHRKNGEEVEGEREKVKLQVDMSVCWMNKASTNPPSSTCNSLVTNQQRSSSSFLFLCRIDRLWIIEEKESDLLLFFVYSTCIESIANTSIFIF